MKISRLRKTQFLADGNVLRVDREAVAVDSTVWDRERPRTQALKQGGGRAVGRASQVGRDGNTLLLHVNIFISNSFVEARS